MTLLRKIAAACGAAPLLAGTLIYVAWRVTFWDELVCAGLITIGVGLLAFAIGAVCLLVDGLHQRSQTPADRRGGVGQYLLIAALLLANFPAAAGYACAAIYVMTRYTVVVVNESREPLDCVTLTSTDCSVQLHAIAPGRQAKQHLRFHADGQLTFTVRQQQRESSGIVEGYVTSSLGGAAIVRVRPDGVVVVEHPTMRPHVP